MSALTLPGDIPGLLQRGSPVLAVTGYTRDEPVGAPGVVVQVFGPDAEYPGIPGNMCVAFRWTSDAANVGDEQISECAPWDLALDLTDPTGRAHASWWLSRQLGDGEGLPPEARAAVDDLGVEGFTRRSETHPGAVAWLALGWPDLLSDLGPDDASEALRHMVLHVAGRPA